MQRRGREVLCWPARAPSIDEQQARWSEYSRRVEDAIIAELPVDVDARVAIMRKLDADLAEKKK